MAQNYISEGLVISIKAEKEYKSGEPYRINGFNGVALLTVKQGDLLSFQLEGVFDLTLDNVLAGDLIYFTHQGELTTDLTIRHMIHKDDSWTPIFGRAVTLTDQHGKFQCRLLQS